MPLVSTPAVVLSTIRYGETSKIVRLATRDYGVQSVIAKGALRPRSRFGAAMQLLSLGQAHIIISERRDLQILTAFDLQRLHVALARDMDRYAAASALAEVTMRFAPADPHPEIYQFLHLALAQLEEAPEHEVLAVGIKLLWGLAGILGFAPSLEDCARDGAPVGAVGPMAFSAEDGGALCARCAGERKSARLPASDRADLEVLLSDDDAVPTLDERHAAAHRRLVTRYIRYHLGEGAELPGLEFWCARSWSAA